MICSIYYFFTVQWFIYACAYFWFYSKLQTIITLKTSISNSYVPFIT